MKLPARIGPYVVRRALGAGAAGSVFLAEHPRLGVPVAIKVLHDPDPDFAARFRREAEVLAKIKNPRVVEAFEGGVSELGPYLVLEYCPGQDLASYLKERGVLEPRAAALLVAKIARGVEAIHAAGAVHRDLKPGNVLVQPPLEPKVADLGLASQARGAGIESLTQSGVVLGTPAYMAPEQLSDARQVDARGDVYALGVILYECLSGHLPFAATTTLQVMHRIMEGESDPLPPGFDPTLVEIVTCAMSRHPADRFSSAALLAESLEEFAEGFAGDRGSLGREGKTLAPIAPALLTALVLGALWLGAQASSSPTPSATSAPSAALTPTPVDPPPAPSAPSPAAPTPGPLLPPSPSPPLSPSAESNPKVGTRAYFARKRHCWTLSSEKLALAARRGETSALLFLALRYHQGRGGVEVDRGRARQLYEQAALLGEPDALLGLAAIYGQDPGADLQKSAMFAQEAAERGSFEAQWARARTEGSREEALATARRRAELGDPGAVVFIARRAWDAGELEVYRASVAQAIAWGLPEAFALRARLERTTSTPDRKRLAADYRVAAEADDSEGQCGYARCLQLGIGVEANPTLAQAYREKARAVRPHWAQLEKIHAARHSGDVTQWWTEVRRLVSVRPPQVPRWAWEDLALHLLDSSWLPEGHRGASLRAGLKLLLRLDPFGSVDARIPYQHGLALSNSTIAPPEGETRAGRIARLFARAAALGHREGLYAYGYALARGAGVPRDLEGGASRMEEAAERGLGLAWERLGDLFHSGLGGDASMIDEERAQGYYRRASKAGRPRAGFKLATLLLHQERFEEGFAFAKQSADLGSGDGRVIYADCLLRGRGTPADPPKALPILEAEARVSPLANALLSRAYRLGYGVEIDLARAKAYRDEGARLQAEIQARAKSGR